MKVRRGARGGEEVKTSQFVQEGAAEENEAEEGKGRMEEGKTRQPLRAQARCPIVRSMINAVSREFTLPNELQRKRHQLRYRSEAGRKKETH